MTTPWRIFPPHSVNDNFKIQQDFFLKEAHGILVEEIMVAVDDMRNTLGMQPWVWFLYDVYFAPDDLQLVMTAADQWWLGSPWQIEMIFNPVPPFIPLKIPDDTQRLVFSPSNAQPSTLVGFDAFIANYIQDIAKSMNDIEPIGLPLTAFNGVLRAIGMATGDTEHSAQTTNSVQGLRTDPTPEFDADLNQLRPKICLACIVPGTEEDTAITCQIHNVFPLPGGVLEGQRNMLNRFILRKDDDTPLTGVTVNHMFVTESFTATSVSMYVLYDGNKVRRFNQYGKAVAIFGSTFEVVLAQSTSHIWVSGSSIWYVSGGQLRRNTAGVDVDIEVNIFEEIGRTVNQVSGGGSAPVIFTTSPNWFVGWSGLDNIGNGLPDVNDPVITQVTGFDRVLSPSFLNRSGSTGPLVKKGDEIFVLDTAGTFQFAPFLTLGEFYVLEKFAYSESFTDLFSLGKPDPFFFRVNEEEKEKWPGAITKKIFGRLNGNVLDWRMAHEITLFPGPVGDTTSAMSRTQEFDLIKQTIPSTIFIDEAGRPTDPKAPEVFSFGSGTFVVKGLQYIDSLFAYLEVDRRRVYKINMEGFVDEPYSSKTIQLTFSFSRANIAQVGFTQPPIFGTSFLPGDTDGSGIVEENEQRAFIDQPVTISVDRYAGKFPPVDESDFNSVGGNLAKFELPTNPNMIQAIDQPNLFSTIIVPNDVIRADGFMYIAISSDLREDFTFAGRNVLGADFFYGSGTQAFLTNVDVGLEG